MNSFLIGWAAGSTIALFWTIYLLMKKPTEVKEVNIRKAKMKKNENSNQEFTSDLGDIVKQDDKKRRIFKRKK